MISIIVPVFNAEKYLDECVQSVLNQSFKDFELILVDDGSTDTSGTICDGYAVADVRVRALHKRNEGANSARIMGLDHAYGEFVVFVDSDDFIHNDALEILMNNMDEGVDAVIANSDENITMLGIDWAKMLLERRIRCEIWGGIYKLQIIKEALKFIPSSIVIGEDLLTNLYYAINAKTVKFIDKELYSYNRCNAASLVNSYKLSLAHERTFIATVDKIVSGIISDNLSLSLFKNKYFTLERLVFFREGNTYQEDWVKSTMQEKELYKNLIGFKEKFLLSVPSVFVCRWVLKTGMSVKRLIRKYL